MRFLTTLLASVIVIFLITDVVAQKTTKRAELGSALTVTAPAATAGPGSTVLVPIMVDLGPYAVSDFQFDILYDSSIMNPTGPSSGCVTAGAMTGDASIPLTCNISPVGRLNMTTVSTATISGTGIVMYVRFTISPSAVEGQESQIQIREQDFYQLSGQVPPANVFVVDGSLTILGPTAASTSVGGRITSGVGLPIANVRLVLTDSQGNSRSAISNGFGYYRIDDVPAGEMYFVSAGSKRYTFAPRTIFVGDEIANLDLIADQ